MNTETKSLMLIASLLINLGCAQCVRKVEKSGEKLVCMTTNTSVNQHGTIGAIQIKVLPENIVSVETDCKEPNQILLKKSEVAHLRKNYLVAFQELECAAGAGFCSTVKHSVSPSWKSVLPNRTKLRLRSFFVLGVDPNPKIMFLYSYEQTYPTYGMTLSYRNNQLQEVRFSEVHHD